MTKKSKDNELESGAEENGEAKETVSTEKKKRIFDSRYNPVSLRDLILSGADALEIMSKLKIKHKQTLKQYTLRLINDDQKFYQVPGLYMKDSRHPKVNPKGELRVNLKKLGFFGEHIQTGDEFHVTLENEMLILTKIDR